MIESVRFGSSEVISRRLVTLDFGGYPYPLALSRTLALRGHEVHHLYFSGLTPRTSLDARSGDPPSLRIQSVDLGEDYAKYQFVTRWRQERVLARRTAAEIDDLAPDLVMASNTPLDVLAAVLRVCRRRGTRFVFWLQDLIGVATDSYLRERLPLAGRIVGRHYLNVENRLLRRSDRVIAITDDFLPLLAERGVESRRTEVIENWAPIAEIPQCKRDNPWARRHDLVDKLVFLYAGTLGLKHRPDLLVELAERLRSRPDGRVVVCSEGPAMDWLRGEQQRRGLPRLVLLDLQPYDLVPETMASADVLVGLLEPTASSFSVPSKVQTYLCAGRPLLVAIPSSNLAARMVAENVCGLSVEPADTAGFLEAAETLATRPALRSEMGARARLLAEEKFDAESIADRFERAMRRALADRPPPWRRNPRLARLRAHGTRP